MMGLVWSRVRSARALLAAAALVAVVTTVLLTAFVLLAQLLPVAAVQAVIADAPAQERTLRITAGAGQDGQDLQGRDAAVRQLFADGVAGVRSPVAFGGYASGQQLPEGLAVEGSAVVGFLAEVADHAELVAGRWPQPIGDQQPLETVLPRVVANELGLTVGDHVSIVDARAGGAGPVPLVLVGVWQPDDRTDPYWQLLAAPRVQGATGPFVIHRDEFIARYQQSATLEWVAAPEPEQLAKTDPARLTDGLAAFSDRLAELRDADAVLGSSLRLHTGMEELAQRLQTATVVNRSAMVLPAALLVSIAGYGLVLLASLVAAHRRGENALLRARGASRAQLVAVTAVEAVLVVAPAAVLGAPVGTSLVALVDQWATATTYTVADQLSPYGLVGSPTGWLVAVACAVACAVALVLPAGRRGRTWVAEQQQRARPTRAAVLQRAGVDLALVALAVLAWLQLRRYGNAVDTSGAGFGVDPVVVAAPVLAVLAATAVVMRLLPLATRLGVWWTQRRQSFAGVLGMWQADRRPHAGPVLLLVLAVATAVLAPAVVATWQQSQRDQAAFAVGADVRVAVADSAASSGGQLRAELPEGSVAMPVHRTVLHLADVTAGSVPLLAVDSAQAAQVMQLRQDLSTSPPPELFAALRQGRPELVGLPLPDDTQRLTGRFRFQVPDPAIHRFLEPEFDGTSNPELTVVQQRLPTPWLSGVTFHFLVDDGTVRSVNVGQRAVDDEGNLQRGIALDHDGSLDIDVALPPDAVTLVGLSAGVTVGGWDAGLIPESEPDPVPVSWHWQDLHTVDVDGAATPLPVPDSWQVSHIGEQQSGPQRIDGELAVTDTLEPIRDYPGSRRFLLTAPPPTLSLIPIVVTADILDTTGLQVGDPIAVRGGFGGIGSARIAGVVQALPGTPNGSGAVVDLQWMSTHQLLWQRLTPAVTEWWAATPDGEQTEVGELAWVAQVQHRQAETDRLLSDPLGTGLLMTLWAAAAAGVLLAGFGLFVDSRATAVQRRRELAVLHTLGASPSVLARALTAEQALLAGLGVAAGALVGLLVAAVMAPSLVLTPAGEVPLPVPVLALSLPQLAAPTLGLFIAAAVLGGLVAYRARREIAAGALRIGEG